MFHSEDYLHSRPHQKCVHPCRNVHECLCGNVCCAACAQQSCRQSHSPLQPLPWLKRIRQRQSSKENSRSHQWYTQPQEIRSLSTHVNASILLSNAFATSLRSLGTFCLTIKSAERQVSSSSGSSSFLSYLRPTASRFWYHSLRYHRLHPEYIHQRIERLGLSYNLRILLLMCDIVRPLLPYVPPS